MKKSRIPSELISVAIAFIMLIGFLSIYSAKQAENSKNLLETGLAVQGVATKTRDYFNIGDQLMGKFGADVNCAISLRYTVEGQEYTVDGKAKRSAFDQLDEDGDGQATVTVRYDPEKVQNAIAQELSDQK